MTIQGAEALQSYVIVIPVFAIKLDIGRFPGRSCVACLDVLISSHLPLLPSRIFPYTYKPIKSDLADCTRSLLEKVVPHGRLRVESTVVTGHHALKFRVNDTERPCYTQASRCVSVEAALRHCEDSTSFQRV